MKNILPLIVLLVMGAMLMISWGNIADAKTETAEKYSAMIERAKRFEEKRINVDAIREYESALKLKPDYNMAMHVADLYLEEENDKGYLNSLNTAINCDPLNPAPYFKVCAYHRDHSNTNDYYRELKRIQEKFDETDIITEAQKNDVKNQLKELLGNVAVFHFYYDEFFGFHRYEGRGTSYAKVRSEDKYGIIDAKMGTFAESEFDDLSLAGGGFIPIRDVNEYYFIDTAGDRRIVPDKPATALGSFGGGVAPLQVDGKYGYIDTQMNESHYDYEYAGSFENGIAPVKQDGKWFVINTQFAPVGPNFDEILVDAYGFCAPYGVYFGKSGNSWGMYSTAGEKIADGFEEVRQFASTQPAAVKKDGKWCFISLSGEIVLETTYEDADSFSLDYAPVQKGGIWGCINQDGEMIVDPQFKMLGAFNEEGNAIGENAEGLCTVSIPQYK